MAVGGVIKGILRSMAPDVYRASKRTDEIAAEAEQRFNKKKTIDDQAVTDALNANVPPAQEPLADGTPPPSGPAPIQPESAGIDRPAAPPLPGVTGLNLDYVNTTDDIKEYMGAVSESIRPGKRAWDEVRAGKHREVLSSLIGRDPHHGFSDRQLWAIRTELLNQITALKGRARIMADNPDSVTDEMRAKYVQDVSRYVAFQEYAQGASAEAGRALNSMKMLAQATGNSKHRMVSDILNSLGGDRRVDQMISAMADSADEVQASGVARHSLAGGLTRALVEVYVNGLISGPATWAVNAISNTAVMGYESMIIKPMASMIGHARTAVTGGSNNIHAAELASETYGTFSGWVDGMRLFASELAGKDYNAFGKLDKSEMDNWQHVSAQGLGMNPQGFTGKATDFLGKWYVRVPGRILQGQDQWFKSMIYRQELNSEAFRTALKEVEAGDIPESQMSTRVNELINAPSRSMHETAMKRSEYQTFTNPLTEQGGIIGNVANSVHVMSMRYPMLKFIVPFIRTPANLLNYAVENGLPLARSKWREDLMAGGVRTDTALARLSGASMMFAYIVQAHDEGRITGDQPGNAEIRDLMQSQGIPPNSIKLGDEWVAYDRADPMGLIVAMWANSLDAAAYAQDEEVKAQLYTNIFVGMLQDFTSKSYMQGAAELVKVMTEREQSLTRTSVNFAASLSSGFIPSWMNYVGRSMDVTPEGQAIDRDSYKYSLSEEGGISDAFAMRYAARSPWHREDLNITRNWKGEPSLRDQGGFAVEAFPLRFTTPKDDPVSYQMYKAGVKPKRPRDTQVLLEGNRVSLLGLDRNKGEVYWKFAEFVGKERYKWVKEEALSMDEYNQKLKEDPNYDRVAHEQFQFALTQATFLGKTDFEEWYFHEAPKHPDWVQPNSIEWDEMNERLTKAESGFVPRGSEPPSNQANVRIMQ